mgnify:FL=1
MIFSPEQRAEISQAVRDLWQKPAAPAVYVSHQPAEVTSVPSDVALLVETSGSQGSPKLVMHTIQSLKASVTATHEFLGAKSGDTWTLQLPLNHIAGIMVLLRSIMLKSEITDSGNYTAIVPTQLYRAINKDEEMRAYLKNFDAVLVGGGSIEDTLLDQARESGIKVITTYGMSETAGGCVYNGMPLNGTRVSLNENLISITSQAVGLGYLNGELFGGTFKTQDLGELVDGKLKVLGRVDDVAISGGEKVRLIEVENHIRKIQGIQDVHVFAEPDLEWGQKIIVAVVGNLSLEEIRNSIAIPAWKPRGLIRLETMPLKGVGKPDRDKLGIMPLTEMREEKSDKLG